MFCELIRCDSVPGESVLWWLMCADSVSGEVFCALHM